MSKDKLEQFISEHREEFDQELPGLHLWNEIDTQLHPKVRKGKWQIATRAVAGVALFLVAGYFIWGQLYSPHTLVNQAPISQIAEHNPELSEITEFYSNKINKNMSRLAALGHHDADLYRDMKQMENMYDTLRVEWLKNPHKSDEQLVNAMIANFQHRSMLLDNVIHHLERGKRRRNNMAQPALFNH